MLLVPLAWFLYAYEEMLFVDITFIHYSFHLGYTLAIETKSFKRHESINRFVRRLGASTVCLPEVLPSIVMLWKWCIACRYQLCCSFMKVCTECQYDKIKTGWVVSLCSCFLATWSSLLYILSDLCCFVHYFCCSCYSHSLENLPVMCACMHRIQTLHPHNAQVLYRLANNLSTLDEQWKNLTCAFIYGNTCGTMCSVHVNHAVNLYKFLLFNAC